MNQSLKYNLPKKTYELLLQCIYMPNDINKYNLLIEVCSEKLDFYSCTRNQKGKFLVYHDDLQLWKIETTNQIICRFMELMDEMFKNYRPGTHVELIEDQIRSKKFKKTESSLRIGIGNMRFYNGIIAILHSKKYDDDVYAKYLSDYVKSQISLN